MLEFLKKVTDNGSMNIEYNKNCFSNNRTNKYIDILKQNPDNINLYFCAWIKDITKNRSAENIAYVNKITIDLDVRKESKTQLSYNPTNKEIIEMGINLWEDLKKLCPDDFGQWSYIVFSWNGLQIHYFWKKHKVQWDDYAEMFRFAMVDIYKEFYKIVWWVFVPDEKVWDLWHLFRLPNTINEKEGIQNYCEIIARQDIESNFVNRLDLLILASRNRKILKEKEVFKKKVFNPKFVENTEDTFEYIRKKVDVAQVLLKFIPERILKKDNKNFTKPWKAWNNSYFVDRENNIILRNGSKILAWNKEWLNPLDIVEEYLNLKWKNLLNWFIDNKFIYLNK